MEVNEFIKRLMNDPKSFDHLDTVYWDKDTYVIVRTEFTGKNKFGGVVRNWMKVKVDLDGNVLEMIEQGS